MAADSHPNIIRYYAKSQDRNYSYLAVEYCKGTLAEVIEMYDLPEAKRKQKDIYEVFEGLEFNDEVKLSIIKGIINGLDYLHSLNIIHKNLKPKNVLISSARNAKLSDIGFYQVVGDTIKVNEDWLASECSVSLKQTKESDVFALGCIIYYVLTSGKHPFESAASGKSIRENVLSGSYNLSKIAGYDAQYLVEHMICKDPFKRYQVRMCKN